MAQVAASFRIANGPYTATVSETGATLVSLDFDGEPLISGGAADEAMVDFRGAVLAPWPNRVDQGRYEFDGQPYQLALSETSRGNALHGLIAWQPWTPSSVTASSVDFELCSRRNPVTPSACNSQRATACRPQACRSRSVRATSERGWRPTGCPSIHG